MSDQTLNEYLDENCVEESQALVCEMEGDTKVIEKPADSALDAPATKENKKVLLENKEIV